MNKFKTIIIDLYYRFRILPLLLFLWYLLITWKRCLRRHEARFLKNREKLDHIWTLSERLSGQKYIEQQKYLRKMERDFLQLEEGIKEEEEYIIKQKELFEKYSAKVFDPHFGDK